MKKTLYFSTAIVLASAAVAAAQLPTGGLVPSPAAIAEGAKQGAKDAASAQVQGAQDAATDKAAEAAAGAVGGVAPGAAGAAAGAAAAQQKVDQVNQAAESAKQTGDAIKGLGAMGGGH